MHARQRGSSWRSPGRRGAGLRPARGKSGVARHRGACARELKSRGGICIDLEKRIPVARGLGGGSSDAAAALVGVLRLGRKRISRQRLLEIAASLGADVPFFLLGGRALGTSRGDEIYPLADMPRRSVVVVSPRGIGVSTPDAYGWLRHRLTKHESVSKLWSFCALCWSPQGVGLSNDFEAPVFRRHPRLARIRRELLQAGAAGAALAGSGSAVFGIFRNPAQARRAAQKFPEDEVFLCSTLSRRAYAAPCGVPRIGRGARLEVADALRVNSVDRRKVQDFFRQRVAGPG